MTFNHRQTDPHVSCGRETALSWVGRTTGTCLHLYTPYSHANFIFRQIILYFPQWACFPIRTKGQQGMVAQSEGLLETCKTRCWSLHHVIRAQISMWYQRELPKHEELRGGWRSQGILCQAIRMHGLRMRPSGSSSTGHSRVSDNTIWNYVFLSPFSSIETWIQDFEHGRCESYPCISSSSPSRTSLDSIPTESMLEVTV